MTDLRERTLAAQGKATAAPAFKVRVNGDDVIVDPMTLTGLERRLMKGVLSVAKLGYTPDEEDGIMAMIWLVLRRTDPTLEFDEVCNAVTLGDLAGIEKVDPSEDDSPEA